MTKTLHQFQNTPKGVETTHWQVTQCYVTVKLLIDNEIFAFYQ